MRSIPSVGRKTRKPQGTQERKRAKEEEDRSPLLPQPVPKPPDDGILVVDRAGKAAPIKEGFVIPQVGKTLPLNQRFARMWRIPQKIVERLAFENRLRRALNREEFTVYYQPQADVETGQVVGAEALVRWQHPERGLLLPDEFIHLAEDTGVIAPLDTWVLRTACAQSTSWQEAGLPPLRVAVNVSARQFQEPDLVKTVDGVLNETRLDPDRLELEITEGIAMQNADFTIAVMSDLRDRGIRISIDDFGAGYSSLNYLSNFPIHALKIDQSFVRSVTREPNNAAIATAIIALAHSLNLEVVAEGVETEDQLAFFRERQCDRFQGFLLSEAVPSNVFRAMLKPER